MNNTTWGKFPQRASRGNSSHFDNWEDASSDIVNEGDRSPDGQTVSTQHDATDVGVEGDVDVEGGDAADTSDEGRDQSG